MMSEAITLSRQLRQLEPPTSVFAAFRKAFAMMRRALAAVGRAIMEACQAFTLAMHPQLTLHIQASPRAVRRQRAAALNPAGRRALRLQHRARRRWLRHQLRRPQ